MSVSFLLATAVITGLAQSRQPAADPDEARFLTSDIDNFWESYDASGSDPQAYQTLYFDRASPGLQDFIRLRIGDAETLARTINTFPRYYASIRQSTLRVKSMEGSIRSSFYALKYLYPEAVFPDVYFLVGRASSGGTTSSHGLLIGVEMYGRSDSTPNDELTDWLRQVIKPVDEIPHIVAHELVHYQQRGVPDSARTLLAQSINEGSADFVAELISGKHINHHVHEFALPRESELWSEFRRHMSGSDLSGWLYGDPPEGQPADLGYFFGYRIAEAYYDLAADKSAAVTAILRVEDFEALLEASGYNP